MNGRAPPVPLAWLLLRIALPFALAGGILSVLPLVFTLKLPVPYRAWTIAFGSAGIALGMATMVGLLVARAPRGRRLTVIGAVLATLFLVATWLIAADPFCWRGYVAADGACAWE